MLEVLAILNENFPGHIQIILPEKMSAQNKQLYDFEQHRRQVSCTNSLQYALTHENRLVY